MLAQVHTRDLPVPPALSVASGADDRMATRRQALVALDAWVRPLLMERLPASRTFGPPIVALTIYDVVSQRTNAGGHWSVVRGRFGLLSHTISSYAIAVHFDADERPAYFRISGARDLWTDDATPQSLDVALDRAIRWGPLTTWAPNLPPGISL